jgi:hypothetical protein
VIASQYDDVLAVMMAPEGTWGREVPLSVIPREDRPSWVDASWLLDGEEHRRLRLAIRSINHGSTRAAREFTQSLTRRLLAALKEESPPWNLATVIDEVSIRVIIEHTLRAPPLLEHSVTLRRLAGARASSGDDDDADHGVADGGDLRYFRTVRQPEWEDILRSVCERYRELPDGLARYLVGLSRTGDLSEDQVVSQLAMLLISYESQAAATASLIGMILSWHAGSWPRAGGWASRSPLASSPPWCQPP